MLLEQLYKNQMQRGGQEQPSYGADSSSMPEMIPQVGQEAAMAQDYNPFDIGIARATQSARAALQMAPDQESRALRSSILAFGDSIGQQPVRRGFMNNFGQALKALGPSVASYDQQEAAAMGENQAMAEKIRAYQRDKQMQEEAVKQRALDVDFRERQLGETRRAHDMSYSAAMQRNMPSMGNALSKEELKELRHTEKTQKELNKIFTDTEKAIIEEGEEASRGRGSHILDKTLPGGWRKNSSQAKIDTLGDVLRGKLFNAWGYKNQAEFNHVPSISSENSPEVNQEIIQQLKGLLLEKSDEDSMPTQESSGRMLLRNGIPHMIPEEELEEALASGEFEVPDE